MGGLQGDFASLSAAQLGSVAISAAVERAGVAKADIEEVVMGCVLPAGQGQAPARQASRGAGLPDAAGCTTVNKMCGSGMKAAMFAHDLLIAGTNRVMVAGGMESMTNAPYLLPRARAGYRMGHDRVIDHMFLDGLEDAYDRGRLMGAFAEDAAQAYQFSREKQDAFALASLVRARKAGEDGELRRRDRAGDGQGPQGRRFWSASTSSRGKAQPEKIPTLKPAFREGGTVTAANSSSISDGAAALVHDAPLRGRKAWRQAAGRASSATRPSPASRQNFRRPRSAPSARCSPRWAGRPARSTSGKSTKLSPSSR